MTSHCPSEERLACWMEGTLAESDRSRVTEHLASCDPCRQSVALAHLMKADPVHALTPRQEEAALRIVQVSRGRPLAWATAAAAAALLAWVAVSSRMSARRPAVDVLETAPRNILAHSGSGEYGGGPMVLRRIDGTSSEDFELTAGHRTDEGTLRYFSSGRAAVPGQWIGFRLHTPLAATTEGTLWIRYRSSASRLHLRVDDQERVVKLSRSGPVWVEEHWTLPEAGLRNLALGVAEGERLDVDAWEVRTRRK